MAGFRKGDEVFVKRDILQRAVVRDVYTLPDQTRVYLVLAASTEAPDLAAGSVYPWITTLTDDNLCTPLVSWKPMQDEARSACFIVSCQRLSCSRPIFPRWWDRHDFADPKHLANYWPTPASGWAVGHCVSVPASVLDYGSSRKLAKIVFIGKLMGFAEIAFPRDSVRPEEMEACVWRLPLELIMGPAIVGPDLASVEWTDQVQNERPVSPLDLGSSAYPVTGKRTRVLSDHSTCLPPRKLLKPEDEHVVSLETDEDLGFLGTDEPADQFLGFLETGEQPSYPFVDEERIGEPKRDEAAGQEVDPNVDSFFEIAF